MKRIFASATLVAALTVATAGAASAEEDIGKVKTFDAAKHELTLKGKKKTDIELTESFVCEDIRDVVVGDSYGQGFGDGGFTDAGFAEQNRIILGSSTENLNNPFDLFQSSDHRIELSLLGFGGEVKAIFV